MKKEKPKIPKKPFGILADLRLYPDGTADIIPKCLMCGKVLESTPHYESFWIGEEFENNYLYFLCDNCFKKYMHENPDEIEEKIMTILATGWRARLKEVKNE